MHILKKIIGTVLAVASLVIASPAFGQTDSSSPVNRVPVFVNDLQLMNNPIGIGGNVSGVFTMTNGGSEAVSSIFYAVQIRGRQSAGGSPSILYGEKLFGPIYLKA